MNKKLSLFLIITALFASSIFSQKTVVLSRSNGNKVIDGVINWHNTGSPVNMDAMSVTVELSIQKLRHGLS